MEQTYELQSLENIQEGSVGKKIEVYGRAHNVRKTGSTCFIVLRDRIFSLQCVGTKKDLNERFQHILNIPKESCIHVKGELKKLPPDVKRVESCYYHDFELQIDNVVIISKAYPLLIDIDNMNQLYNEVDNDTTDRTNVGLNTRLNTRYLELRTPLSYCIFKVQAGIGRFFRQYLNNNGFIEIHSPKLIGTASESGASVFSVKYFNQTAYLAQSPQLYKQMAINADFQKVYEVGHVFRAENSVSHRHLCEFVGLDIEMKLNPPYHYHQIIRLLWSTLMTIFMGIETTYKREADYIRKYTNTPLLHHPIEPLIIEFVDGVQMLNEKGYTQNPLEDLSTENEKHLGNIVKELYGSDLFVLTGYPQSARPFYTMPRMESEYSNSFDVIMRGEEICSGSQRVNDYDMLLERLKKLNLNEESFKDYLESFKYGSFPHGGCGFGLERILMLYFGLMNVRVTSLFPRDPSRLKP